MTPGADREPAGAAEAWAVRIAGAALPLMLAASAFRNNSRAGRVAATAALLACAGWLAWRGTFSAQRLSGWVAPMAAVLGAAAVACIGSIDPGFSWHTLLRQHLWFPFVALAVAAWCGTRGRQRWMLASLAAAGAISAAAGVFLYYFAESLAERGAIRNAADFLYRAMDEHGNRYQRARGTLESYTRSAALLIATLPATVALAMEAMRGRRWGVFAVCVACGAVSAWLLLLTKSRGAWIGAAAGCTVAFLLMRGRWWLIAAGAGAVLLALAAMPTERARALSLVRNLGDPNLLFSGRLDQWKQGLPAIRENLVTGIGYGGDIFQTPAARARYPLHAADKLQPDLHNVYLQILAESGLLGAAAYGWLLAMLLAAAVRAVRRAPAEPGPAAGAAALAAMLMVACVYNFNEAHIGHIMWATLGLVIAGAPAEAREPEAA